MEYEDMTFIPIDDARPDARGVMPVPRHVWELHERDVDRQQAEALAKAVTGVRALTGLDGTRMVEFKSLQDATMFKLRYWDADHS